MSEPAKDNRHIRSNKGEFIDAYLRARKELGQIDGVVGVGFGRKEIAGEFTDDVSITVFVREKKSDDALAPEQRIPPAFDGYRTDVRLVPKFVKTICDNQTKYPTIQGGIQIQSRKPGSTVVGDAGKGTLGCIVRKRGNDSYDNYYLLTNEHVLFHPGGGRKGSIYHPSAPPAGDAMKPIAFVDSSGIREEVQFEAKVNNVMIPFDCYIDCAIARLDIDSRCCESFCPKDGVKFDTTIVDLDPGITNKNRVTDVRSVFLDVDIVLESENLALATDANRVFKVGRTTGRTVGIVTGVNVPAQDTESGVGTVFRHNVIEVAFDPASTLLGVNCKGRQSFVESGDSGSLVVDKDNRAIGLVFGGREMAAGNKHPSYVCHILPVLDQLKICIPTTTGTSYGSSLATDGSGIAAYGGTLGIPEDDGKVLFSSASTSRASVSDDRRAHMQHWLDTLRETERGRELHQAFVESHVEMRYLVRSCRPVTVAWHRNRGPAFLASVLAHLKDDSQVMPKEIDGISLAMLLQRMAEVLSKHGSDALRAAIGYHRDIVMLMAHAGTAQESLELLRRAETAEVAG